MSDEETPIVPTLRVDQATVVETGAEIEDRLPEHSVALVFEPDGGMSLFIPKTVTEDDERIVDPHVIVATETLFMVQEVGAQALYDRFVKRSKEVEDADDDAATS